MEYNGNDRKGGDELSSKRRTWMGCFLILSLFFTQIGCMNDQETGAFPKPEVTPDWVEERLEAMSLEEKVGQLFMVGFESALGSNATGINDQVETLIDKHHVGGIILFRRNVESTEQVAELTNEMQKMALSDDPKVPLLIAADQEGGKITRVSEGVTVFPGNMPLGATRHADWARQAGHEMGKDLKAMGIHLDFAPVLDVNNNPKNPVIGIRSFGEDPHLVADMGTAMIRGFHDAGVFTAVKHFPGHGDTAIDSHIDLPKVPHNRTRLDQVELIPFKKAIEAGTDLVMSAHVTFPAIEPTPGLPATLSKRVLTDLLRKELGFQGIIITDDMEMGAIANRYGTGEAAVKAIEAGADMILVCHTFEKQEKAIYAVQKAVREGRISEQRIDESVRRILKLKAKRVGTHSLVSQPYANGERVSATVGRPEVHKLAQTIADHSVTLVRGRFQPISPRRFSNVLVLTSSEEKRLESAFREVGYDPTVRSIAKLEKGEIAEILEEARSHSAVVIAAEGFSRNAVWRELIGQLSKEKVPLVVLGLGVPYDATLIPQNVPFIAIYGSTSPSLKAGAKAISGQLKFKGRLPVTINGLPKPK